MELGKVLVSGGTGYLASHLLASLPDLDVVMSLRGSGKMEGSQSIMLPRKVTKQSNGEDFDTVIHAAHFNNFEAEAEFINSFSENTYFIFFSSAAIYGETSLEGATTETEPCPINDYGRYKLKTEELVSSRFKKHLILRISNPYAKEPRIKGVYQIFKSALEQGQVLNINADKQGALIRDFIHIDSFVEQVKKLLLDQSIGCFNISSGVGISLEDFVAREFPELEPEFNYLGFREGEIQTSVLI